MGGTGGGMKSIIIVNCSDIIKTQALTWQHDAGVHSLGQHRSIRHLGCFAFHSNHVTDVIGRRHVRSTAAATAIQ